MAAVKTFIASGGPSFGPRIGSLLLLLVLAGGCEPLTRLAGGPGDEPVVDEEPVAEEPGVEEAPEPDTDAPVPAEEAPRRDEVEEAPPPEAPIAADPLDELPPLPVRSPWAGLPADPEIAAGALEQEVLPALQARTERAGARLAALDAWRGGTGSLDAALPDLAGASLSEPAVLAARLRHLDARYEARLRDRHATLPEGLPEELVEQATTTLDGTLDAEAASDRAEREAVLSLRAWLRARPWLRTASLERLRAVDEATVRAARGLDADDPATADARDAALRASEDLTRLDRLVRSLRDAAGGEVGPTYDEGEDLAALEDPLRASGALLRLSLLEPELADAERASVVRQAIVAARDGRIARLTELLGTVGEGQRPDPAVAKAELARANARREALPPLLAPLSEARIALATARVEAAQQVVADDADATRREAAEAASEGDAASALTAALIAARAPAEERVHDVDADLADRRERMERQRSSALAIVERGRQALLALATPDAQPPEDVDTVYADVRGLLTTLRERGRELDHEIGVLGGEQAGARVRIADERARIRDERAALAEIDEGPVHEARSAALDRWSEVLQRELELRQARVDLLAESRDASLRRLHEAAALRESLARWASRAERARDRAGILPEAVDELSVIGPSYLAVQRGRFEEIREDPWSWLGVAWRALMASLWLLGAVVVWYVARRYAGRVVDGAIGWISHRGHLRNEDLVPLRDPLHRTLVTGVDVAAAGMLFGLLPEGLPEFGVLLVLVFEVQLLRMEVALFELFVARPRELRPALMRMDEDAWRSGRRTVLVLGLWLSVRRVLLTFSHDVLSGFATEYVVRMVSIWVLVVLVVVLAYLWASHLREQINRHPRESWVTKVLGTKPPTVLLAGPQALGGMLFLAFVWARDLFFRAANQRLVSQWFAAVDRLRVGQLAGNGPEEAPPQLPAPVRQALLDRPSVRAWQERPEARKALLKALHTWKNEGRQGLLALLGDTGDGRRAALARWRADWEAEGLATRTVTIQARMHQKSDAYVWLAREFGLPSVPHNVDEAVALLEDALEPGVVVVYGLHLTFLRTVGGFDALRTLLEVWHADGRARCWVLAFYRPAWRYLERLGNALNMHLVRAAIDLDRVNAKGLRQLTTELASQAGYTLDFDALASTGALAGDPEVERERAVETYYRVLASASGGNPAVALQQWVTCLSESPDQAGHLRVHVSDEVRTARLPELSDDHLFVLAAVRTQGEVAEKELAEVLNMGLAQVRGVVRQMLGAGLLSRSERGVYVTLSVLPSVTSTLRRRHFLHWSA